MGGKTIDRRSDPLVRALLRVRDGEDAQRVFCEGFRVIEELLRSGWTPQECFAQADTHDRARALLVRYQRPSTPIRVLAPSVMSFVSALDTPPGVIVVTKRSTVATVRPEIGKAPLILVLHGLQLPQNVGAILRSAEAAGVSEVWATKSTADPFNPKSIRASSGSVFRVPVNRVAGLAELSTVMNRRDVPLVAAALKGNRGYDEIDWTRPTALVVGSEGAGLSDADLTQVKETIRIPMQGMVESLGVAPATAILLFEACRQRRAANT